MRLFELILIIALFGIASVCHSQEKELVLEAVNYKTDQEARAVWAETGGDGVVSVVDTEEGKALQFPCNFTPDRLRCAWDAKVSLNLSEYTMVSFKIKIEDAASLSTFAFYFRTQSGGWWAKYNAVWLFSGLWQEVLIPFNEFACEGTCNGWDKIVNIRFSPFGSPVSKPTTIWVRDIKAISYGHSPNMLANSGFEYCSNEKLPDYWGTEHWGLRKDSSVADTDTWRANFGVDNKHKHSGKYSMRIVGDEDITDVTLSSQFMGLTTDSTYTFSAWMRSDMDSMPVTMRVEGLGAKEVQVGREWKRYWITGKVTEGGRRRCQIFTRISAPLWIDDVQMEESSEPTQYAPMVTDIRLAKVKPILRAAPVLPDYPIRPGPDTVRVQIDEHRRFLVDGEPFIPYAIGWESLPTPVIIHDIAKGGFNSVCFMVRGTDFDKTRAILDSAKENGLKVIFWFAWAMKAQEVEKWITEFKDHPTIIAWYIYDEPSEITPEIRAKYEAAKRLDPGRPAYINYIYYTEDDIADIASLDRYPIPSSSPASMAAAALELETPASKTGKPSWIWLQSTGNSYFYYRQPWDTEAECMAYISLIHGVRGIKYFAQKPESAAQWNKLRMIAGEVRELTPILYSLEEAPEVKLEGKGIDFTVKQYQGKTYIISLNTNPKSAKAEFSVPKSSRAAVMFENRNIRVRGGSFTDNFGPYQRHVYCLEP